MTLPTLAHAHVLELRAAVAAGGRSRTELRDLKRNTHTIRDLEEWGLLVWDAGNAGETAEWMRLTNGAVVPTDQGRAFVWAYLHGREHAGADVLGSPTKTTTTTT